MKIGKFDPKISLVTIEAIMENKKYVMTDTIMNPMEEVRNFVRNFSKIDAGKVRKA
ncbi:MAG: hypothetical protein H0Z29_04740 [Candidatus Marinimicrobia bacterium]|nr:hypothetical protein [Candidatus Neomarinimicrobiota bacterium]